MNSLQKRIKETKFIHVYGEFKHRWWLRPICWIKKHTKKWVAIYGIKYKQCSRCGKDFFTKKVKKKEKELENILYRGEMGELYRVKYYKTKKRDTFV